MAHAGAGADVSEASSTGVVSSASGSGPSLAGVTLKIITEPSKETYVPGTFYDAEKKLTAAIKTLRYSALDRPDDARLWRKVARFSFRLWHLNLDRKTLVEAKDAYAKALSVKENQSVAALWGECALVYTSAGAYDGAIQLLNNLIQDCPAFNRMPRVYLQLAGIYRRVGNYDKAFHFFLLVLREKEGPIPAPLTQFHIILEIAVTYELRAIAMARGAGGDPDIDVVGSDEAGAVAAVDGTVTNIFDALPPDVDGCVAAAREGYREAHLQYKEAARIAREAGLKDADDIADAKADNLVSFWRSTRDEGWRAWRMSWGVWLSQGVEYAKAGFDVLAAHAFSESLALGGGKFLHPRPSGKRKLVGEKAIGKTSSAIESRLLNKRIARLAASGVETSSMVTRHEEEKQADAWLVACRSALRAGDSALASTASEKVMERRPLSHFVTPTRSMLAKCGNDEVRELVKRRAGADLVFRLALWRARTYRKRRIHNAKALIIRSYRWYRVRKWGKTVGRPRRWARGVLQRAFNGRRVAFLVHWRKRAALATRIKMWYRSALMLRRMVWRREKWREIFRDKVRAAVRRLQAWFRMWPLAYRYRNFAWAVPIIQRAWRCFYARVTVFYLREHRRLVKKALRERDQVTMGSLVIPRRYVRQTLRKPGQNMLAGLTADERAKLRAHNDRLAAARDDFSASLMGEPDPVPAREFLAKLLSHTDRRGRIHRKAARQGSAAADGRATAPAGGASGTMMTESATAVPGASTAGFNRSMDTLVTRRSSLDSGTMPASLWDPSQVSAHAPKIPVGDRLSGLTRAAERPRAPLEGYFEPKVWARARELAAADADADADAQLANRQAALREKQMRVWAAMRAKRDRKLAGLRKEAPRKPQTMGYGPEGEWSEFDAPPVLSVIRAKAVPKHRPGLALATSVAVQKKTGLAVGMNMAMGNGIEEPTTKGGKNLAEVRTTLPPLPPGSPIRASKAVPGSTPSRGPRPQALSPIESFLTHSMRDPSPSPLNGHGGGRRPGRGGVGGGVGRRAAGQRVTSVTPSAAQIPGRSAAGTTASTRQPPLRASRSAPRLTQPSVQLDGDDPFFQSVDDITLGDPSLLGGSTFVDDGDDSFSESDPEDMAPVYDPKAKYDGVSGARGYLYAPALSFSGTSLGGSQLRTDGAGWSRFQSESKLAWDPSTSIKPVSWAPELTAPPDRPSTSASVDEDGVPGGVPPPAAGTATSAPPHPRRHLPGTLCVELDVGEAKHFYAKVLTKLVNNVVKWQKASPFHWRGMLAKRAEDAVDVAARTHHADCSARNCKVVKGLLELVRRARVTAGYSLRDYVLYMRTMIARWGDKAAPAPVDTAGVRAHDHGVLDSTFPTSNPPRPDPVLRKQAQSMAMRLQSVRNAKEQAKQGPVRDGSLMTTSMFHSQTAAGATASPMGMAGATYKPKPEEQVDVPLEEETKKYRTMYRQMLVEQLNLGGYDTIAMLLDSMMTSEGLAPDLALLHTILTACANPRAKKQRKTSKGVLGPGEVAIKVVVCAAWAGVARGIDFYNTALRACKVHSGRWEWAAFLYKALQEAGLVPDDDTNALLKAVCVKSVTSKTKDAAYAQLKAVGVPMHILFEITG